MSNPLAKSKETTLGGAMTGLALIIGEIAKQFDGDPATNMEMAMIVAAIGLILTFWRSRDQSAHDRENIK